MKLNALHNRTLIFLHIPKAGGSTMNTVLDWQYGQKHTYTISVHAGIPKFQALPESERAKIKCLKGQFAFGIHKWIPNSWTYTTVIRDPIKRVISNYFYENTRRRKLGLPEADYTLEEYILTKSPMQVHQQLRLIIGGDEDIKTILHHKPLPDDAVEIALSRLQEHFCVAGLLEEYELSIMLMAHVLGWSRVWFYPRLNTATKRASLEDFPLKTQRLLKKLTEPEREFYEQARQRFYEQVQSVEADLVTAAKRLKRNSRLYTKFYEAVRPFRKTVLWRKIRQGIRR